MLAVELSVGAPMFTRMIYRGCAASGRFIPFFHRGSTESNESWMIDV
jgi:hypothetical protein